MQAKPKKIRIAVQKDGRLKDETFAFLETFGLKFIFGNDRNLITSSTNNKVELLHVRHSDIPQYVQSGAAELGIVGANVLAETNFTVKEIKRLSFGKCRLVIAVPENSKIKTIADLAGERIATSHTESLRKFLKKNKIHASIVEIKGSVEIATELNLSDAICDITQTGKTLKEHRLKEIAVVYESEATLIQSTLEVDENILEKLI